MKISAVIITFNEERNIARCIDSLQDIADEILIIDSFSTDRTEEICKQYKNVIFIPHAWEGYSVSKNFGNAQAKYDYIFSIDADEAVSDELKKSILEIKNQQVIGAYSVKRLTNYCGWWIKHCGWYPDIKMRLWNRNEGKWEGEIHEEVKFNTPINVTLLKGDLLHYSYYNLHDHIQQIDKFTDLTAKEAFNRGKKPKNLIAMILHAQWKFIRDYILKLGILDGYAGYLVCKYSSVATFTKYAKLKQLCREKNQ